MSMSRLRPNSGGFTLIEMVIVIAVMGILITLAAPSLRDFILVQRLKSVNAQLVTDLQFARSEAVARNQYVRLSFRSNDAMTCYSIYTSPVNATRCDCLNGAGAACSGAMQEIRTVQFPSGDRVTVKPLEGLDTAFAFDHVTGGIVSIPTDRGSTPRNSYTVNASIEGNRVLRTVINTTGRITVCAPGSGIAGTNPC